ncbi:MAG: ATP-dependent DNA helicase RecG [Bacteroidota bacterium]
MPSYFLQTDIKYLKGVGEQKAALLQQELNVATFGDLVAYYPFRYEDRSELHKISALHEDMPFAQLRGKIVHMRHVQSGKERVTALLRDGTGEVSLVFFRGLHWILQKLQVGAVYTVFGRLSTHNHQLNMVHPELEPWTPAQASTHSILPVYATTEKLKRQYLDSKAIAKLQHTLLQQAPECAFPETLPMTLVQHYGLMGRSEALTNIHFPENAATLQQARFRLKFEELFYIQVQLLQLKKVRLDKYPGKVLADTQLLQRFYHTGLPFELTGAQKRVIKEIYRDLKSGHQMNRLVQGDVGSGKTMVAFLSMLLCIGSQGQVAMMAPTELLAEQHYRSIKALAEPLGIDVALLTGTVKRKARNKILGALAEGRLSLIIGTHALLNEAVGFHNLGLVIVDEQHRFGVAQRAKLWTKHADCFPHVLVMTATPIPRTLAMTLYGDLDVSIIDELPAGRKPIKTLHYYDANRLRVFHFLKHQIKLGRQVYIVYPLIEESEKLDYKNLMDGYESICRAFPEVPISIVHGQMYAVDKEYEMERFVKGETKIMVATTVIEVGVNVPNASVMVVENAEKFGLAQLHQLRGRVGRGSEQSYCILMTKDKLNPRSQERIQTMVRTHNGFEIADVDLKLRGPGDLLGVQQSGILDLKIADLSQDSQILQTAREAAQHILRKDPTLEQPCHTCVQQQLALLQPPTVSWSSVS